MELLENGKDVRFAEWKGEEVETLNNYLLLSAKPVIYLVNLSEKDYIRKKNKWYGFPPPLCVARSFLYAHLPIDECVESQIG